ncbi:RNHCP domain-containing protein [Caldibacillus debilis]|jgi:Zn finger protein HypA/HybF involved in hydrogenase expression|uniref:RNHCP domain n=1 Tax=Caldibacillus debilis GB1 TaxID=1339248 RepID=A0A420VGL3_9BACI|nr:RNHCP domain-containing protein [Caldibacillus debilis]RKO62771.1 RNHCP domain [Caldibacillus debilis GB1]
MGKKEENAGFRCGHCGIYVKPLTNGSYRNHCPNCLYSKHVDIFPGDRKNACRGLMKPVGIDYHSKKGYQLIHQCLKCGAVKRNKIAEDTEQPDRILRFLTDGHP